MGRRFRRMAMTTALVGAGGFLMSGPGTGCTSLLGTKAVEAADFCFIFDCNNGILGGTIDPCAGARGNEDGNPSLLMDCNITEE